MNLRVAQVVRPAAGGIRSHVRGLIYGLDRMGFANTLYGPSDLNIEARVAPHVAIDIRATSSPFADPPAMLQLAIRLRGHADIVHAHGLRGALIGVPAARLAGIPAIFTAHNLVPVATGGGGRALERLQSIAIRLVARRAAGIVAVSEAVAASLVALGIGRERITVIPNGVDLATFAAAHDPGGVRSSYHVPRDAPLVVAVGRLAPEKGMDTLLAAFPAVLAASPDAHLIVAGDGPERDRLRALLPTATAGGDGRIHLVGAVSAVPALLAAADVVAIPSRREGQGLVAIEAMAAARAVVASSVGGLVETLQDGETGLLVPPNAPTLLAEAICKLLSDVDLRARYGNAGRRRAAQRYTLDHMLHRTAALYASICSDAAATRVPS